jgi:hypothetical protein
MKYAYLDSWGKLTSVVDTGASDTLPDGAIALPNSVNFQNALNYGYDIAQQKFVELDESQRPSAFHVFDFLGRKWVYLSEQHQAVMRDERNRRLLDLDMYVCNPLRWNAMSDQHKQMIVLYRQKLLDVPQQDGFPQNIDWPIFPDF